MTKLHIITYATHSSGLFEILKKSAKKNNIDLKIIGLGQKWKFYGKKFEIVLNYIKINKLSDEDIVLFVDAFDVILLGDEKEILKKYNLLNNSINDENKKDLIFSYTKDGFNFVAKYFLPEVNSGLFMGKVKKIKFLFNKIIKYYKDNEIEMKSSDFVLENYKKYYYMDTKNVLFYNYYFDKRLSLFINPNVNIKFKNNRIIVNEEKPAVIHFPKNTADKDIVNNLGYSFDNIYIDKSMSKLWKDFANNYIEYYCKKIILIILIIVLLYILLKKPKQ